MRWPQIHRFGDKGLLVDWQPRIDEITHAQVLSLVDFLKSQSQLGIIDITPTYSSVAIYFSEMSTISKTEAIISQWSESGIHIVETKSPRIIEVPVCYDASFGIDLDEMSSVLNLSISEIIAKHTAPLYRVYFLGFLPGFPYLGGLDDGLKFPRKANPRQQVASGSIAIGGEQTGIYPSNSPGGWNILGRTPLVLFDVKKKSPALFSAGDGIKFKSVTLEEYVEIEEKALNSTYKTIYIND